MMNIELVITNNIIELQTTGLPYTPPSGGGVDSVNGKTGDVTLVANDVGAYSKSESDNLLSDKVDKEAGKGLSTNDYTNVDKTKVSKIITNGVGDKYLGDDGNYKTVSGGGVTSVNAKTGVVVLNAGDVGAVNAAGVVTEVNKFLKVGGTSGVAPITHSSSSAVALGYGANAGGSSSIAIGYNTTAENSSSIAIGSSASVLGGISGGIAIGDKALANVNGIAIGLNSKAKQSSVAIGYNANNSNSTHFNCVLLGSNAVVTSANQVQLGDSATTTYAYGAVQDRSDVRDKTDIQDCTLGLDFINALRPVKYKWDYREDYARDLFPLLNREDYESDEAYQSALEQQQNDHCAFFQNPVKDGSKTRNREHHGLIAQEFKQVLDNLGIDHAAYQDHSANGGMDVKSMGYVELIPNLIKAIQDISAKVESLENGILMKQ